MNSLSLTCLSLCVLLVGLWTPTWADPRAEGVPPREEAVTAFSGPPDATAANALLTPKPATAAQGGIGATRDRVIEAYGKLPLHFEANLGQTDPRVKFLSRGPRHTVFLTSTEAVLVLTEPEPRGPGDQQTPKSVLKKREQATRSVLHMTFLGANVQPRMAGREELPGKANYFIGRDPSKWHVNVPTYARVHYHDLYPDIDLVYYGNQRQLEYDLIVQPGAEPGAIVLAFQGTERLQVNAQGDLVLETAASSVRHLKPVIYLRKYVTDTTRQGGPQVRRVMKERSHYGLVRALLAISEELVRKLLSWRHPGFSAHVGEAI